MDAEGLFQIATETNAAEVRARELHWEATVVLGYCNLPLRITEEGFGTGPILGQSSLCATNLERLILGGVNVIVWSPGIPYWTPAGRGLCGRAKVCFLQQQLEAVHSLAGRTEGLLRVARNAGEIREINRAGGIAILLHLSGANHLNDLGILKEYYDLGVRMIHCGFQDQPEDAASHETYDYGSIEPYFPGPLDSHGARTIEEMKKLGIIVDMAHIRAEGFDDIVPRLEGTPFVYSHGGCHSLVPHWRNLDDARIEQIARHRGVYGIGVYIDPESGGGPLTCNDKYREIHRAIASGREARTEAIAQKARNIRDFIRKRYSVDEWNNWEVRELARHRGYPAKSSILHVVAHMKYLRDHFGPEIVGYGPDYEYSFGYVAGLEEADKTPSLTRDLLAAGFSAMDTQAALGHNFMRVFREVLT